MNPQLLHIYGPLAIHSYGAFIVLGLLTFLWLLRRDSRLTALVDHTTLDIIISLAIIAGVIGGRLLSVATRWNSITLQEALSPWEGGFSILGTILAITTVIPLYLYAAKIPILPLLDLAAIYAPAGQAIARLGCFFTGCCYGQPSSLPWATTYTHHNALAPCFVPLHPTQIYSSLALFTLFLVLYFFVQKKCSKPGQLVCCYFIGMGIERFIIDFWRADHTQNTFGFFHILSIHQWIASGIVIVACSVLAYLSWNSVRN